MTAAPQGGAPSVGDSASASLVRTSRDGCLQAAIALAELCDAFGPPSVAKVAARLGMSKNGTHLRLLGAVDHGLLLYRERESRSFAPTERLWAVMDHLVRPVESITVMEGE